MIADAIFMTGSKAGRQEGRKAERKGGRAGRQKRKAGR
jgi:hypothetical protein